MPIRREYLLFFFSSRRRHTRSKRDWSSDVCSSDLLVPGLDYREFDGVGHFLFLEKPAEFNRSEERRVGKECRFRGAADHQKKKERLGKVVVVEFRPEELGTHTVGAARDHGNFRARI